MVLLVIIALFTACKTPQLAAGGIAPGLHKVTILYPNGPGKTFNMDYYQQNHMPMMAAIIGSNLKFYEIDKCLSGRSGNDAPPYAAIGYFYIESIGAYNDSIAKNRETVMADLPKYTNIQPEVFMSQVLKVEKLKAK